MKTTPTRRRLAAGLMTIGAALVAVAMFAPPAQAGGTPAVFPAGYDTYLNENQRGLSSDDVGPGACPTDAAVAGLTSWHFVLPKDTHDFLTLDVRVHHRWSRTSPAATRRRPRRTGPPSTPSPTSSQTPMASTPTCSPSAPAAWCAMRRPSSPRTPHSTSSSSATCASVRPAPTTVATTAAPRAVPTMSDDEWHHD